MTTAANTSELTLTTLRILRRPEIRTITGFCDEQIDKMEARKQFPRRIHTGARTVGWVEHEVRQWLLDRMAERDDAVKAEEQRVARMPPGVRHRLREQQQQREMARAEEAEIITGLSTSTLTDRERAGDVWNDSPA